MKIGKSLMKIGKPLWKFILGGGLTYYGWFLVAPEIGETALTGAAVIGIVFLTLGVSILSGVWD